ncbi:protein of unknown function [Candidatus Hydrogenisulfobacillus filiaventi]|uniref:Uncharacterized protein n=1 Tax=Candidatus Hydrogenisulfobacillus filiaventi TaxID=2707344 RepID=A0A6F8ZIV1_9FIRM|nr:protein of unknown function [Candidatus Hydrogenisulfobacillus filiaventi]
MSGPTPEDRVGRQRAHAQPANPSWAAASSATLAANLPSGTRNPFQCSVVRRPLLLVARPAVGFRRWCAQTANSNVTYAIRAARPASRRVCPSPMPLMHCPWASNGVARFTLRKVKMLVKLSLAPYLKHLRLGLASGAWRTAQAEKPLSESDGGTPLIITRSQKPDAISERDKNTL